MILRSSFYSNLTVLAIILLLITCTSDTRKGGRSIGSSRLSAHDVERIVLVGGTLISGMEQHPYFEYGMLRHFAGQKISFRNIGWPADDGYGLARSQFGSAQNTMSWQPPTAEEGFGSRVLIEHIQEAEPTTLMVGYGSEVAFAKDENDFQIFTSGYLRLLDSIDHDITLVLMTPSKLEVGKSGAEVTSARNAWLKKASDFTILVIHDYLFLRCSYGC